MDAKEYFKNRYFVKDGEYVFSDDAMIEFAEEYHQLKSKEEAEENDTLLLDTINKALRRWGVKEKLSFGNGIELLTCLQEELLPAFGKEE